MIFYKFQNTSFVSPKEKGDIIVFTNLKEANIFPKYSNNKTAIFTSDVNILEFWINKKIDYIINPFDFKSRAFDNNTFSLMKQKNIIPIIILDFIFDKDHKKQNYLFKHLILFNKLCKKNKLPILLLSNNIDVTNAMYYILGYSENQAKNFLSELYES
jgi:hypothetical protein